MHPMIERSVRTGDEDSAVRVAVRADRNGNEREALGLTGRGPAGASLGQRPCELGSRRRRSCGRQARAVAADDGDLVADVHLEPLCEGVDVVVARVLDDLL